jgi:hypothetical protein
MIMTSKKQGVDILKRIAVILLLMAAGGFSSCGKEKEKEKAETVTESCNRQTERQEEQDIMNMETKLLKKYPENLYQYNDQYNKSSFICERDSIATLHVISGTLVIFHEICNFPQSVKDWIIPDDGLSIIISGKVFAASRDHGFYPAIYGFHDLELTS